MLAEFFFYFALVGVLIYARRAKHLDRWLAILGQIMCLSALLLYAALQAVKIYGLSRPVQQGLIAAVFIGTSLFFVHRNRQFFRQIRRENPSLPPLTMGEKCWSYLVKVLLCSFLIFYLAITKAKLNVATALALALALAAAIVTMVALVRKAAALTQLQKTEEPWT